SERWRRPWVRARIGGVRLQHLRRRDTQDAGAGAGDGSRGAAGAAAAARARRRVGEAARALGARPAARRQLRPPIAADCRHPEHLPRHLSLPRQRLRRRQQARPAAGAQPLLPTRRAVEAHAGAARARLLVGPPAPAAAAHPRRHAGADRLRARREPRRPARRAGREGVGGQVHDGGGVVGGVRRARQQLPRPRRRDPAHGAPHPAGGRLEQLPLHHLALLPHAARPPQRQLHAQGGGPLLPEAGGRGGAPPRGDRRGAQRLPAAAAGAQAEGAGAGRRVRQRGDHRARHHLLQRRLRDVVGGAVVPAARLGRQRGRAAPPARGAGPPARRRPRGRAAHALPRRLPHGDAAAGGRGRGAAGAGVAQRPRALPRPVRLPPRALPGGGRRGPARRLRALRRRPSPVHRHAVRSDAGEDGRGGAGARLRAAPHAALARRPRAAGPHQLPGGGAGRPLAALRARVFQAARKNWKAVGLHRTVV
ncbi:Protein of unknown function, partial [Gryllus bimaculatus]